LRSICLLWSTGIFKQAHGNIKKIFYEEIIECHEHSEGLIGRLEGAHNKFLDRIASVQTSRQPHVVNYVADALMEEDEALVKSIA
jgi:hypothetical protein